jgi:LysR family transcriptional regulator, hydrogen peroxide-inducible genes activator
LEDLLGVQLLERTKRSVTPTPIGLDLAARARAILGDVEDLTDAAAAAREPMSGPLRLGMIPTIGPFLAQRILPNLRKNFPKLQVYLREEQTAVLQARLENGEIDAALLALPVPLPGMETFDIAIDPFWVVFPEGHRLAKRTAITQSDIALEDILLLEDGHCLREHALTACSLEGARRNIAFQGTSLHTLVQMVESGLGITLAPQIAIDAGILRGLKSEMAPLAGEAPYRRLALAWRKTSPRKKTLQAVAESLRAHLNSDEQTAQSARSKAGGRA